MSNCKTVKTAKRTITTAQRQSQQRKYSNNKVKTVTLTQGQLQQRKESQNNARTVKAVQGQSQQSKDSHINARTVTTAQGQCKGSRRTDGKTLAEETYELTPVTGETYAPSR